MSEPNPEDVQKVNKALGKAFMEDIEKGIYQAFSIWGEDKFESHQSTLTLDVLEVLRSRYRINAIPNNFIVVEHENDEKS